MDGWYHFYDIGEDAVGGWPFDMDHEGDTESCCKVIVDAGASLFESYKWGKCAQS